jgi:hypothetical protein
MVSNKRFVKTWVEAYNSGRSIKEVARKLSVSYQQAVQRSSKLRKKGVQLPVLVRTPELDADELNELINNLKK